MKVTTFGFVRLLAGTACSSPTQSSPISCGTDATAVTFESLNSQVAGSVAPSVYTEARFNARQVGGEWLIAPKGYIFRAPTGTQTPSEHVESYLYFPTPYGAVQTAALEVTNQGCPFTVTSLASLTAIPYELKGLRNGATVYSVVDTLPPPHGVFQTVTNPHVADAVDTLNIVLTNAPTNAVGNGSNPVGLAHLAFNQ